MPLIELSAISKSYTLADHTVPVLHDVHLDVQRGEMLAILGASGSGKSTLMNILGLLDTADSGCYQLDSEDVTGLSEDQQATRRNQQIGFVFQQFNLLPRLNSFYNVALPLQYRLSNQSEIKERVHQALSVVGMESYLRHLPTQLSGGQQQRVAIARALVGSPEVILADEPTGALDSKTSRVVMDLFHQMHSEGRTIIIITHDSTVAAQCQRQCWMADGVLHAKRPV